jgi:hypothetical protein
MAALRFWHRRDGAFRTEPWRGPLSPWKKRAACRWQRRCDATDSSAEQRLEVGCFARFRRAPPPTPASVGAGAEHGDAAAPVADLHSPPSGGRAEGSHAPSGASQPPVVARLPLGRRRFGSGTTGQLPRDSVGACSDGRRVSGDVGVRASGSEHHRIGISSSHTVPAFGRDPRTPPATDGALRSPARTPGPPEDLATRTGRTPAMVTGPRRSSDRRTRLLGTRTRSSSEPRLPFPGTRPQGLLGAPPARPPWV